MSSYTVMMREKNLASILPRSQSISNISSGIQCIGNPLIVGVNHNALMFIGVFHVPFD